MAEITVQGRVHRMVTADEATLRLSANTHGPDRERVLNEATSRHRSLSARASELETAGLIERFAAEEIHTWSNWAQVGDRRVTEHFAQVSMSLTVTQLDEVGELLTEFTADGYDVNVAWELSTDSRASVQRELRGEAVDSAREAAEDYCAAIGMSVLTVRAIRDEHTGHGGAPLMARAMMAEATPIEVTVQEIEVSVALEATYVAT